MRADADLVELEVFAYVGEDDLKDDRKVGLKAGLTPVGLIPLVAVDPLKLDRPEIRQQLQAQVDMFGKRIRLVRLVYATTIFEIAPGGPG